MGTYAGPLARRSRQPGRPLANGVITRRSMTSDQSRDRERNAGCEGPRARSGDCPRLAVAILSSWGRPTDPEAITVGCRP